MTAGERAFAALFVLAVAVAVVADRFLPQASPAEAERAPVPAAASAAYCLAPDAGEAKADIRTLMDTSNVGAAVAPLRRFTIGEGRAGAPQPAGLPPMLLTTSDVASFGLGAAGGKSGAAAGVVESFASPVATDGVLLARGGGAAAAPCTGQPATRWYFAAGSTSRGQDTYLLVVNPFLEDASIGVRLLTGGGAVGLPRLRELTIRPLSETVLFLGDFHPEDESFGIDVTVPRGRLVVGRYIRLSSRAGAKGLSLALGVRNPAQRWQFAEGDVPKDGEELLQLANPGEREALAQVVFQTTDQQVAPPELEEVAIPAGSHVTVKVSDRLPRGTRHGTTVVTTNGEPIVAERQTTGSGGMRGTEVTPGMPEQARRWIVHAGTPVGGTAELALVNSGRDDATAGVTLATPSGAVRPPELTRVPVPAGRRVSVDLTPFLKGQPATVLVDASSDGVAAEGRVFVGDPYLDFADTPARPLDHPAG
ncbi:MAG TPA: DUF5719 family protein [Actinomycetota bacterium]